MVDLSEDRFMKALVCFEQYAQTNDPAWLESKEVVDAIRFALVAQIPID